MYYYYYYEGYDYTRKFYGSDIGNFSASDTFGMISGSPQFYRIEEEIYHEYSSPYTVSWAYMYFGIYGHHSNAGWTSMHIGDDTFLRTDAYFSQLSGGPLNTTWTRWRWSTGATESTFPSADWGSAGSTQTVYFK